MMCLGEPRKVHSLDAAPACRQRQDFGFLITVTSHLQRLGTYVLAAVSLLIVAMH